MSAGPHASARFKFKLRRCAAVCQCINFRLDYAPHTMQVPLKAGDGDEAAEGTEVNSREDGPEYAGGRLVFLAHGSIGSYGLRGPPAPPLCTTAGSHS